MKRTTLGLLSLSLGLFETACVLPPGEVGELPSTSDSGGTPTGGLEGTGTDTDTDTETGDASGAVTTSGGEPPSSCGPDGPPCHLDQDGDCVGLGEDNAPAAYNPDQSDIDGDGFPDVYDLCATLPGVSHDTLDSDDDGLGNECDPCRRAAAHYATAEVPGYMQVRNIPSVSDADGDGIGDACDNCVRVPNCDGYDLTAPWRPGDPLGYDDVAVCQADADGDMIGDACEGMEIEGAAGPVGLGPDDDFDQDGLSNVVDACSRLPVSVTIACTTNADCPNARKCETAMGICDHLDTDGDGVGDRCDTCPATENPMQIADGAMQQGDDSDGDFVGNACEPDLACEVRVNPRRVGYYPVEVGGQCCTVAYRGDGSLLDPDGLPILVECPPAEEGITCRGLPLGVLSTPGLVMLPPGCEAALADAGLTVETHQPLTPADVGGLDELWTHACMLPPFDHDFDGIGDECDLCSFAFDPTNEPYVDPDGMLWPDAGAYCHGAYAIDECTF